jgi:hypothetical protein
MEKCLNCGTPLQGKYCYNCGQEKISKRMSVKSMLHDFFHSSFHWESAILNTIKELFFSPGKFIGQYIEGKRKSYAKPVTFFVLMLSVYVIIFHLLSEDYFSYLNQALIGNKSDKTIFKNVSPAELQHMISNKMNYFMFILPPVFAFFFRVFFRKTQINFAEALAFSFYIIGFGLLISSLFTLTGYIDIKILNFRFALTYAYYIYAIVQFSQSKIFLGILKSILSLLLTYAIFIIFVTAIILAYLILFR